MPEQPEQYEVALSFAGAQRGYVSEVARHLQAKGIRVFYDEYVDTWGAHAVELFQSVYSERADYIVIFISKEYVERPIPNVERRAALDKAVATRQDCILPVRFDDSAIPGMSEYLIYEDANTVAPAMLASKIAEKLGVRPFGGKASDIPAPQMTSPTGEAIFDYSNHNGRYIIGEGVLQFETAWTKASDRSIYVLNDPPSINGVAVARGCTAISQVSAAGSLDYTSRTRTPQRGQVVVFRNTHGIYAAARVLDIKDDTRGAERDELHFSYAIQVNGSDDFTEFVGM